MRTAGVFVCFALLLDGASAVAQPVLRYTFDEASGNALDSGAGPATNATFQGGAIRSTDTPGGSGMSLDLRTDDPFAFVAAPDAAELDGTTSLTLTTWLIVETYPDSGGNNTNNKRLLSKQAQTPNFDGFSLNMSAVRIDPVNDPPAGPHSFRVGLFLGGDAGFGSALSDAYLDATQWTFIAATYDSQTNAINFYTGGANMPVTQLGTSQFPAVMPGVIDGLNARFAVGLTDAAQSVNASVIGLQDDVRVYSTALDLAALEVVRLENVGSNPMLADGDFNEDNRVDAADLDAWRMGFGTAAGAEHGVGDADADGDVDGADFLTWQQENGMGVVTTPIPESASWLLGAFAAGVACVGRRFLDDRDLIGPQR